MPQNLATLVTRQQVINALEHIISTRISLRHSTGYDLVYKGQRFPPKEVVRKAAELAGIQNIGSYRLNGGDPTNKPLEKLEFQIVRKNQHVQGVMTPITFIHQLHSFLDSQATATLFGDYRLERQDDETSFGTPAGGWDPSEYPAFVFTKEQKTFFMRLVEAAPTAYIVFETAHRPGQLRNFKLVNSETFRNDAGTVYLYESYRMTVGGGRISDASVRSAMQQVGFSTEDDIILSFEENDMDEAEVVKDLLDWAVMQEAAKDILRQGGGGNNVDSGADEPDGPAEINEPLNQILYGPPGTGKTYTTITKAAHILTGEDFTNRYEDARQAYKDALGDRVEFITFHQNYSYEDFVAGLRPDTTVRDTLAFREHKGIFYNICERARNNYRRAHQGEGRQFVFEDVLEDYMQVTREGGSREVRTLGERSIFTIHRQVGNAIEYTRGSDTRALLSVGYLKDLFEAQIPNQRMGADDYYAALVRELQAHAEQMVASTEVVKQLAYVLIIDEINRANISRVFGELITLLEEDKRWGADHEMEVTLPSGERFSVPKNLYLIGTMNTADKSIALVDIALRRRFHFEPMFPNPSLDGVRFREFLTALNEAILKEKGPDFLIGHAYFMPAREGDPVEFASLMNRKVIPLLNEYFYNESGDAVFSLLDGKPGIPEGHAFRKDAYLGVQCERTNNAANGNPPA